MPAVLIHGVPDTPRLWRPVIDSLARKDVHTLALPGFNCALPEDFDSSKEAYAAWIVTQLERIGAPVDLVAHDWGAILMLRVVSMRPDLVRSWAGGGGVIDRDYVWHDLARQWQTPEAGEKVMDEVMVPDTMVSILVQSGVPRDIAVDVAASADARMKNAMLRLYRSATKLGDEWHEGVDGITRPGLVLWGRDDPFVAVGFAERLARRVNAELLVFDNCGHWWPSQRPVEAAQALERFWARISGF
jgi:pimeloyl-ACP methyl ester carboxylesterase